MHEKTSVLTFYLFSVCIGLKQNVKLILKFHRMQALVEVRINWDIRGLIPEPRAAGVRGQTLLSCFKIHGNEFFL